MIKIRTNTFETNSSSSHSLTIEVEQPLFENGVLYPERLNYHDMNDYSDNSILVCNSIMSKLAYYMHYLKDKESESNKPYIAMLVQYFKEQFSIDINFDFICKFSGYNDNGDSIFGFEESVDGMKYVKEAIELIMDSSKTIYDTYTEN